MGRTTPGSRVTIGSIPFNEPATKISSEHFSRGGVEGEGCDVLVVPVEYLSRLVGIGLIKEDQITTKKNRDEIVALPETAELLIIDVITKNKGLPDLRRVHIPYLTNLINKGHKDTLGVKTP